MINSIINIQRGLDISSVNDKPGLLGDILINISPNSPGFICFDISEFHASCFLKYTI